MSANQVTHVANEEQQIDENFMLIEREQPQSLVDVGSTAHLLCMHPSPGHRRSLFWSPMGKQDRLRWALIDTGTGKNLASYNCWNTLPCKPQLRPPGTTRFVAGNNAILNLVGFRTVRFQLFGHVLVQEFCVFNDLPFDIIIGGELIRPYVCT